MLCGHRQRGDALGPWRACWKAAEGAAATSHEPHRDLSNNLLTVPSERVFVSPLSRAQQTLEGLAASSGVPLPPQA